MESFICTTNNDSSKKSTASSKIIALWIIPRHLQNAPLEEAGHGERRLACFSEQRSLCFEVDEARTLDAHELNSMHEMTIGSDLLEAYRLAGVGLISDERREADDYFLVRAQIFLDEVRAALEEEKALAPAPLTSIGDGTSTKSGE